MSRLAQFAFPLAFGHQTLEGVHQVGSVLFEQKFTGDLADGFSRGPTIQGFRALVPIEDALIQVHNTDGVMGLSEQGGLFPDLFLCLFAFGDIARDNDDVGDLAMFVPHNAALRFDVADGAVLEQKTELGSLLHAGGNGLVEDSPDAFAIVGMNFLERTRPAHDFGIAQDATVGRAVVNPPAVQIEYRNQVGDVFRNQPEKFLPLAQGLFGLLAAAAVFKLTQRAAHGGGEPFGALLEDVIGRATAKAVDGDLFADGPGKQNDRQRRPPPLGQGQRGQAIERRERIIRNDEVKSAPFQSANKLLLRVHPHQFGSQSILLQHRLQQVRVVRIVLQVENAQR